MTHQQDHSGEALPTDEGLRAIVDLLGAQGCAEFNRLLLKGQELRAGAGWPGATVEELEEASATYAQLWQERLHWRALAGRPRAWREEATGRVLPFPTSCHPVAGKGA